LLQGLLSSFSGENLFSVSHWHVMRSLNLVLSAAVPKVETQTHPTCRYWLPVGFLLYKWDRWWYLWL